MNSDFEVDEGYYQGKCLPAHLAERAARVTDAPEQLTLACYRSPEAMLITKEIRRQLKREQIAWDNFVEQTKRKYAL